MADVAAPPAAAAPSKHLSLDKSLDDLISSRKPEGKKAKGPGDKKKEGGRKEGGGGKGGAVKPKGGAARAAREETTAKVAPRTVRTVPDSRPASRPRSRPDFEPHAPVHMGGSGAGAWHHDRFEGGRGGPRAVPVVERAPVATSHHHHHAAAEAPRPAITLGTRVMVTNLDPEITAEDIREIFGKVGELRTVAIHYDSHNKPKGAAEVVYRHRASAEAAVKEFDGRQVDETRVRVHIIGEPAAAAPVVAAAPAPAPRPVSGGGDDRRGRGSFGGPDPRDVTFKVSVSAPPPRPHSGGKPPGMFARPAPAHAHAHAGGRPAPHAGGPRGGGGRAPHPKERAAPKPQTSMADLDAQLAAYSAKAAAE